MFIVTPDNIPLMVSFLRHAIHKLVSLKSIYLRFKEDELPAEVCIPPLHCPSLTTVWLLGITSLAAQFIRSLILPNINTLTKILLFGCRPISGSEFDNFCSCLSQCTSLEHVLCAPWDVDLNEHERKQLASALEQIKSLKVAIYFSMVVPDRDRDLDRDLVRDREDIDTIDSDNLIQIIKYVIMHLYKKSVFVTSQMQTDVRDQPNVY